MFSQIRLPIRLNKCQLEKQETKMSLWGLLKYKIFKRLCGSGLGTFQLQSAGEGFKSFHSNCTLLCVCSYSQIRHTWWVSSDNGIGCLLIQCFGKTNLLDEQFSASQEANWGAQGCCQLLADVSFFLFSFSFKHEQMCALLKFVYSSQWDISSYLGGRKDWTMH